MWILTIIGIILPLILQLINWLASNPTPSPAQRKALGALRNRIANLDAACEIQGIPMLADGETETAIAEFHA